MTVAKNPVAGSQDSKNADLTHATETQRHQDHGAMEKAKPESDAASHKPGVRTGTATPFKQ